MKRLLISGIALAISTGVTFAQPAGAPPALTSMKAPPPQPPGAQRGGPGGPEGHRPPPPPPSRAAHFRLEHGDTALDVKCAEDEPMRACANLTLQLLERLQAMPAAGTSNPAMPNASPPKL